MEGNWKIGIETSMNIIGFIGFIAVIVFAIYVGLGCLIGSGLVGLYLLGCLDITCTGSSHIYYSVNGEFGSTFFAGIVVWLILIFFYLCAQYIQETTEVNKRRKAESESKAQKEIEGLKRKIDRLKK